MVVKCHERRWSTRLTRYYNLPADSLYFRAALCTEGPDNRKLTIPVAAYGWPLNFWTTPKIVNINQYANKAVSPLTPFNDQEA